MKLISDRRDEALEAGYMAMLETPCIANRVNFTLDQFREGCKNFDVWGFYNGKVVGMFFLDGNHPHIAILKEFHGKCGEAIKQALELSLNRHSELIADIHKDNKKAIRFVERLGFKFKEIKNDISTYRLGD